MANLNTKKTAADKPPPNQRLCVVSVCNDAHNLQDNLDSGPIGIEVGREDLRCKYRQRYLYGLEMLAVA